MMFKRKCKEVLLLLLDLLFPRVCCVCEKRLSFEEKIICTDCLARLPRTNIKGEKYNIVERLLWDDLITTQRGSSFLYYTSHTAYSSIYFAFKYHNRPDVAIYFGRMMAEELIEQDFFEGIDFMIPIPLAKKRFRKRGYNQSERLAEGIRQVTGIPINTVSVIRSIDNPTQTQLTTVTQRADNVTDIFSVASPERLSGKHILIIDDVLTTGSTIRSCARTIIKAVPDVRISILTLGISYFHRAPITPPYLEKKNDVPQIRKVNRRKGRLPF